MRKRVYLLVLGLILIVSGIWGDVFNFKVLSDKAPDLTDLPSFVESATSRHATNDRKARAIAHWFGTLGNQSASPYDWMPVEPILQFNTQMNAQCAFWTGLFGAVGEGGMGWIGRHYEVGDHTIPELEYDGTRHYFDNTYKFYPLACDGERVVSITEMDDVVGCSLHAAQENHYLCWHTPMALINDLDGFTADAVPWGGNDTSPVRAWLSGPWLRRDAASRTYFKWIEDGTGGTYAQLDAAWVSDRWFERYTEGMHNVYDCRLNLRDNEYYTRYWRKQGSGTDYYWPSNTGTDPDGRNNERGNGEWIFTPDLSDAAQFEAMTNITQGSPAVHPSATGTEAIAVFKIRSSNLTTGCLIDANVTRNDSGDSVIIEVSANGGHSWDQVWANAGTGASIAVSQNASDILKGTYAGNDLRTVLNYLVRVRMTADGAATQAGLNSITITTLTVINKMSLPRLGLGKNYITVDYDAAAQFDTKALRPLLKNNLYQNDAIDYANLATNAFQGTGSATVYASSTSTEGYATFSLTAPRAITTIRMGGSIYIGQSGTANNYVRYEYRTNDGSWSGWNTVATYDWDTRDNYHSRMNQVKYDEIALGIANVTEVEFKFVFRTDTTDSYSRTGANHLRMEIDYPAADSAFQPIEITYNWTEYHSPIPSNPDSGATREHTERVTSLPHNYWVNTGGDIAPRMNSIRVKLQGSGPAVTLGYDDATDVGDQDEQPSHKYIEGKEIGWQKPYTLSTPPDSDGFVEAGDSQELTDGHVKEPQRDGPWPPKCLAYWAGLSNLEIIVDLQSIQTVGGARMDSYLSVGDTLFPESVEVQTSADGSSYQSRGTDRYKGAKYSHNDRQPHWPLHPRHDSPGDGPFPNYGERANFTYVLFDHPVEARYVKFIINAQSGEGIMLSEIHVYDALTMVPWTPRLAQEAPEDRDGDGMSDAWEILFIGNSSEDENDDHDGDGLINGDELANGTRADVADSDGDGFDDHEEVNGGSDPLDAGDTPGASPLSASIATPATDPHIITTGPGSVSFTSSVSGGTAPYTYAWDFGDANSSTNVNDSNVYAADGEYGVTFTVTDSIPVNTNDTLTVLIYNNGGTPADYTDDSDFDGDGLKDGWEADYLGTFSQDGTGNPDGDGFDNAAEQANGTDPMVNNDASEGTKGGCGSGQLSALIPLILAALAVRKQRS